EVLHDDVELAVGLAQLVDLADVGVRHLRRDARLGDQHRAKPRIVRQVREDSLDHEQLLEPGGALEAREEDLAHAASGNAREQLVPTEASWRDARTLHCGRSLAELCGDLAQTTERRRAAAPWCRPRVAAFARASRGDAHRARSRPAIAS